MDAKVCWAAVSIVGVSRQFDLLWLIDECYCYERNTAVASCITTTATRSLASGVTTMHAALALSRIAAPILCWLRSTAQLWVR